MRRLKKLCHKIARHMVRLEHPFHLLYLGTGTIYYALHEALSVACCSGGMFFVVLAHYLETFNDEDKNK